MLFYIHKVNFDYTQIYSSKDDLCREDEAETANNRSSPSQLACHSSPTAKAIKTSIDGICA
jgi:hypothetical protein